MVAEGREVSTATELAVNWNAATLGYFAALRAPILRGRDFTPRDDSAGTPVMIVNETFAKTMFPNEKAVDSGRCRRATRRCIARSSASSGT